MTWSTVRELALAGPDVVESTSSRTPAMTVRGKLIAFLNEDGETVVVPMTLEDRVVRIAADPDLFFATKHYRPFPCGLVRLAAVPGSGQVPSR